MADPVEDVEARLTALETRVDKPCDDPVNLRDQSQRLSQRTHRVLFTLAISLDDE